MGEIPLKHTRKKEFLRCVDPFHRKILFLIRRWDSKNSKATTIIKGQHESPEFIICPKNSAFLISKRDFEEKNKVG